MTADALAMDEVWKRRALRRYMGGAEACEQPEAILLLGQPGAGTSMLAEEACHYFVERGHCVTVAANELAWLHPLYSEVAQDDDPTAVANLSQSALRLASDLWQRAADEHLNLVLDGAVSTPDAATQAAQRLHERGYRITVVALCVAVADSHASMIERDGFLRDETGAGWRVDPAAHDTAFRLLPEVLAALASQGLADTTHVVTRNGKLLSSTSANDHGDTPRRAWEEHLGLETPTTDSRRNDPEEIPVTATGRGREIRLGQFAGAQNLAARPASKPVDQAADQAGQPPAPAQCRPIRIGQHNKSSKPAASSASTQNDRTSSPPPPGTPPQQDYSTHELQPALDARNGQTSRKKEASNDSAALRDALGEDSGPAGVSEDSAASVSSGCGQPAVSDEPTPFPTATERLTPDSQEIRRRREWQQRIRHATRRSTGCDEDNSSS